MNISHITYAFMLWMLSLGIYYLWRHENITYFKDYIKDMFPAVGIRDNSAGTM